MPAVLDLLALVLDVRPMAQPHKLKGAAWRTVAQRMHRKQATERNCQEKWADLKRAYVHRNSQERKESGTPQVKSAEETQRDELIAELLTVCVLVGTAHS